MKIFITGITGFIGSHLAEYLIEKGYHDIHGTIRQRTKNKKNIESIERKLHLYECDLIDATSIESIIARVHPDIVFHLAAELPHSLGNNAPLSLYQNNIIGTLNLLEGLRKNCPEAKILITGSSKEYGLISPEKCPIKETHPLMPDSPYGVSKLVQFFLASQYSQYFNMKIFYSRIFYLIGPRQPEGFVCSSIVKKAILFKKGVINKIPVGNLTVKRDFIDVRDVVRALFLLIQNGKYGEAYNVCSGRGYSIEEILKIIIKLMQIEKEDFYVDPSLMREVDSPVIIGDNSKIFSSTGWKPSIGIEKSLEDLLKSYQELQKENQKLYY
jgi:GDP-4-dehydro-6-deoxy-D-mannose reductase